MNQVRNVSQFFSNDDQTIVLGEILLVPLTEKQSLTIFEGL